MQPREKGVEVRQDGSDGKEEEEDGQTKGGGEKEGGKEEKRAQTYVIETVEEAL